MSGAGATLELDPETVTELEEIAAAVVATKHRLGVGAPKVPTRDEVARWMRDLGRDLLPKMRAPILVFCLPEGEEGER